MSIAEDIDRTGSYGPVFTFQSPVKGTALIIGFQLLESLKHSHLQPGIVDPEQLAQFLLGRLDPVHADQIDDQCLVVRRNLAIPENISGGLPRRRIVGAQCDGEKNILRLDIECRDPEDPLLGDVI